MVNTQWHFNNWKLYVQIELNNQKNDLFLLPPKKGIKGIMCIGTGKGHRVHDYGDKGRSFFTGLMENFGRVWVKIPGEKSIELDSYEALLNKITSD